HGADHVVHDRLLVQRWGGDGPAGHSFRNHQVGKRRDERYVSHRPIRVRHDLLERLRGSSHRVAASGRHRDLHVRQHVVVVGHGLSVLADGLKLRPPDGQHVAVCLAFHVVVRDTLSIRVDVEQGHAVFVELNHRYYLLPLSVLTKSPPTYSLGDAPRPLGPQKLQVIQNKAIILVLFESTERGGGLRGGGTVETLAGEEVGDGFDELTVAVAGGEEGFV